MRRKVFEVRRSELEHEFWISMTQFDELVDEGYDDVMVITPLHRYVIALDDFLDYGHNTRSGPHAGYAISRGLIERA